MTDPDFNRVFMVPEKTLKNLKDVELQSKKIPQDIFDQNIDTKYMESLKTGLVNILNSPHIDEDTIKQYKVDLAKLMDLEGPERDVEVPTVQISSLERSEKNEKDSEKDEKLDDGDSSDEDLSYYTGSESDFAQGVEGISPLPHVSTPYPKTPDVDETIKNPPSTSKGVRKRLFDDLENEESILNREDLINQKKGAVNNALKIEEFILQRGPGRIRQNSENSFTIDGRPVKGEFYFVRCNLHNSYQP